MFQELGRLLVIFGIILVVLGGIFMLGGKLPWLGRLPGDLVIERKNFSFYFPIATSLLFSVVLTLIFWLFSRR